MRELQQIGDAPRDGVLRQTFATEAESDILEDVEMREQRIGLEHHVYGTPVRRHAGEIFALQQKPSAIGRLETGDAAHQRRFSTSGGAEQREEFTVRDFERDVVERDHRSITLRDMTDGKQGGVIRSMSR